jgi:hypothetical protein
VDQRRLTVRGIPRAGTRDERADRHHAAGKPFGQDQHVGHDAVAFATKEVAAAPEAGLHLVGNQQRARAVARLARSREVSRRRNVDAALALHRFDDESGGIDQRRIERIRIAVRDVHDVAQQRPKGRLERFAAARRERAERLAVIGVVRRHDLRPAGRGAGELERPFDRLRAAICEKRVRQIPRRYLRECAGEPSGERREHRLSRERHRFELVAHGGDHARMGVAQREDAVTSSEIEIGFALVIPNRRAARAHFHGRARKFHHARQRRVDEAPVVLDRLVVEAARVGLAQAAAAPHSISRSRRSMVASTAPIVSAAVSVRINRSRNSLAPRKPLR